MLWMCSSCWWITWSQSLSAWFKLYKVILVSRRRSATPRTTPGYNCCTSSYQRNFLLNNSDGNQDCSVLGSKYSVLLFKLLSAGCCRMLLSNVLLLDSRVLLQASLMTGDFQTTQSLPRQMRRKVQNIKQRLVHFDLTISHLKTKYKRNLKIKYIESARAFRSAQNVSTNKLKSEANKERKLKQNTS